MVDLTGGISKKIEVKENMEEKEMKNLYDEMKRCIRENYLMGCLKYVDRGDAEVI